MTALTKEENRKLKQQIRERQEPYPFNEGMHNAGYESLLNGGFRLGFKQIVESNADRRRIIGTNRFTSLKYWEGEYTDLLVFFEEEGIGIQLLTAYMLSTMVEQVGDVLFLCDRRLIPAFQRSYPNMLFVPTEYMDRLEEKVTDNFQIAIARTVFYHALDKGTSPRRSLVMPDGIPSFNNRIGISWKTSNEKGGESKRNLSLEQLTSVLDIEGIEFISIQHNITKHELKVLKEFGVAVPNYKNIEDYLHIIDSCNMVLSVDNSAAIMAGLLSKETLCMLCEDHIWLYTKTSDVSPWSPTVSLVRRIDRDWDAALYKIKRRIDVHRLGSSREDS